MVAAWRPIPVLSTGSRGQRKERPIGSLFSFVTDACRYLMNKSSTRLAPASGGASAAARPVRAPEPIRVIEAIPKYKHPACPHKGPVGGLEANWARMPEFPAPGRGSGPLKGTSTASGPGLAVGQDRPSLLCSGDSGRDGQDVPMVTDRSSTIMAPLPDATSPVSGGRPRFRPARPQPAGNPGRCGRRCSGAG